MEPAFKKWIAPNKALNTFREELLLPTIASALRTPFYRSHYKDFLVTDINLETWRSLPFTRKSIIRKAGSNARYTDGLICNEVFSGGTTGEPLVTLKGDREQKYISEFYNNVFSDHYKQDLLRALQINNPYHGHLVPIPVPMHSHKIGVYDNGSFAYGREVLTHKHQDRGVSPECTSLVGLERCLRAFTMEAQRACPDGLDTDLQVVISYSQYLTKRWRNLLEETWKCPVVDRFGLSEIFGGATQNPDCGWWHFDPVCLPEVVGARSREIIEEGVGELVLTALYPFQEAQPMIRYLTGDLVEVTHSRSSRPGTLAIRPLGRIQYGVPHAEGDDFFLSPSGILEVLDSFQDISRLPRFRDAEQVSDPFAIGHPYYTTSYEVKKGKTVINLSVIPKSNIRRKILRDNIYEELLISSPLLQDAIARREAKLMVQSVDDLAPDLISHSE